MTRFFTPGVRRATQSLSRSCAASSMSAREHLNILQGFSPTSSIRIELIPLAYAHIAKALDAQKNKPKPAKILQLLRELKRSDEETKLMVRSYIDAVQLIMRQDSLIVLLDKLCQYFETNGSFFILWPQAGFCRIRSVLLRGLTRD